MQRRDALIGLCTGIVAGMCAGAGSTALAHTPYNQWQVYRRKHLLVGCHKDASGTYALAKEIVALLDSHLPKARARVARAPTAQRIASLMATDQMDVAVMSADNANAMAAGAGDFKPYGKVPLQTLMQLEQWILVCRSDIPSRHAWLIADALLERIPASDTEINLPHWHSGALLRHQGQSIPD